MTRENEDTVAKKGLRKLFFTGGTSACRSHIRQHYPVYVERCKKAGVAEHHWAVPRDIMKAREKEAKATEALEKGSLTAMGFKEIPPTTGPRTFSKESVLEQASKFIICTDKVSDNVSGNYFDTYHLPSVLCHGR